MRIDLLLTLVTAWARRQLLVVDLEGASMLPTLHAGDVLLCSTATPLWVGAIVVQEHRFEEGHRSRRVKRPTALAGDIEAGVRIPSGCGWLVGDNPAASTDSRTWGPVALKEIRAVALAAVSPGTVT